MRTIIALSVLALFSSLTSANEASCINENFASIKQLNRAISQARLRLPKEGKGRQVDSGICTLKAIKLGIIMGLKKDFENYKDLQNVIDCLELEKYMLIRNCECSKRGLSFTTNDETIDRFLGKYRDLRKLQAKLRDSAIKNPIVNEYVRRATKLKDCINDQALDEIEHTLDALEALQVEQ